MTAEKTLPFQLVVSPGITLSSFTIKKADNDASVMTVNTASNYFNIDAETYSIIQVKACTIGALPYGNYYYALTLSDGSTYISDIIAIMSDMSKCIKITYKNVENLYFSSGHIDFTNDFVFELYLPTTIGKPEYEYEEELTKRLGYKFVESQVVNKVYKFTFPATEQLCDAYRFVRMCDYIRIDTYNPDFSDYDHYNVIYLSSEVEWLDNGDIASVETSFETDSIVQKLQDYSRTQLVNFYNALLSNSDEALKFDDETIAQYYSNYIQSIDGKMIRQLNAVSSISDNTVIAIDENNGTGAANKILLKPLLINTVAEQLQASEVLANFQQHINNSAIHITAAERAVLSLFGVDDNGDVYVKGDKGFYTNSFVSAKGKSSSTGGGSGASALYQLVDVLANENNDGVQGATTNSVLMYNGTKWYAGTIGTGLDEAALKAYLDANKYTTTAYVDSQVSSINSQLDTKADKTSLQQHINDSSVHITAAEKAILSLFGVDDNGDVYVKGDKGFYTTSFVSALGKNSSGGSTGSASALYQLVDVLANENNDGVQGATTNSVLMYNGTKWYAGTINTGLDEAALKYYLDTNKYTTTSYVDSQLDTKADKTALSAYLPLSGGTITGDLTVNGTIYVGTTNYVYHTGNLAGDTAWITLSSDIISHKTIHANNITLIASSGQFVTGYTVDKAGHIVSISQRALNASDIPSIAITQVTGLQDALDKKVDNAFFARVFGLLDANGNEIAVNDVTTIADSIKAKFGLWTEQYISAKGVNSSSSGGSGGASALYQLVDVLANSANDGVLNAANGSVLMYNGSKWQAGNVVTDISPLVLNVNGSSLFTYNGKSSITANLTVPTKISQLTNDSGYLTAITKAQVEDILTGNITSHTHSYLPLTGGTLTGNGSILTLNSLVLSSFIYYNLNGTNKASTGYYDGLAYIANEKTLYRIGVTDSGNPEYWQGPTSSSTKYTLIHSGNYNSYALPLSGGTISNNTRSLLLIKNTDSTGNSTLWLGGGFSDFSQGAVVEYSGNNGGLYLANFKAHTNNKQGISGFRITSDNKIQCGDINWVYNVYDMLHSGNYNSYTPTLTGAGASGTWGISITGNAATATNASTLKGYGITSAQPWNAIPVVQTDGVMEIGRYIDFHFDNTMRIDYSCRLQVDGDYQSVVKLPSTSGTIALVEGSVAYATSAGNSDKLGGYGLTRFLLMTGRDYTEMDLNTIGGSQSIFTEIRTGEVTTINSPYSGYGALLSLKDSNGIAKMQFLGSLDSSVLYFRSRQSPGTDITSAWKTIAFTDSNVASATKLQTARTLWGQSFNGTGNVSGNLTGVGSVTRTARDAVDTDLNGNLKFHNLNSAYVNYWHVDLADGTKVLVVHNNGNIGLGTTSPSVKLHVIGDTAATGAVTAKASSSDIRLKTDISDYKALSIIRSHKSIKYHWNEVAKANADIFNDDYWHYGLIAQDVQRDMPQMVSDVFKDYLVINYERLIPICWKGLQEVDDEVTKLKKKVRKLEMEIRELKQKEDRL